MKMRRIVTAESKSGVVVQVSDLLETTSTDLPTNIWGFDQLPNLPLAAEQVLGEYQQKGLFGPKGAVRVERPIIAPGDGQPGAGSWTAYCQVRPRDGPQHNARQIGRGDAPHRQHRPRGRD